MLDVVRDRFGDEPVFTWWNRRSDFYETDREVWVDRPERGREGSTDHAPMVCDISRG